MSEPVGRVPYRDSRLEAGKRVEDLLGRMTLEEKVAQMTSDFALMAGRPPGPEAAGDALAGGIGQVSRPISGGFCTPGEGVREVNACQRFLVEETRLGIPAIIHEEALSGLQVKDATLFPQAIGQGSTWSPDLIERMAAAIRRQMREMGVRQALSPNVDVVRDPRWGRVEECFGEDPFLVACIGAAFVRGLQGEDPATGCIATLKHFLGYSASEGGRNQEPAHIGPRALREVFGVPFETVIREAGARAVMNSYCQIDGVPVQASRELLTDLLRDEYGFEGLLVSDYGSIDQLHDRHCTARDTKEAAVQALRAGMDVELPLRSCYGAPLIEAVGDGSVSEAEIDTAVRRILTWKIRLGLFEHPCVETETPVLDTSEDRALAREVARASIVLLRNQPLAGGRPLLPLSPDLESIAVVGPNAARAEALLGDYSYPIQNESIVRILARMDSSDLPPAAAGLGRDAFRSLLAKLDQEGGTRVVTVLEGIRSSVGAGTVVRHAEGCAVQGEDTGSFDAAITAARASQAAVVVVGDQSGLLGFGTVGEHVDSATLALPGVQRRLVEAMAATGTPTVVVLTNGRPFVLDWMEARVPAIVEAWFPGEEGGTAVAEILFGRANPGGKSCVSFPRHAGIQPLSYDHRPIQDTYYDASIEPVFPFGHGLSYTSFAYADLEVEPAELPVDGVLEVRCRVTNTGERAGDEVVQLYVRDLVASSSRPVRELRGFHRLSLEAGASARVWFRLAADRLALYRPSLGWVVEPGEVDLMLGSSSRDIRLRRRITLVGGPRVAGPGRVLLTPSGVEGATSSEALRGGRARARTGPRSRGPREGTPGPGRSRS